MYMGTLTADFLPVFLFVYIPLVTDKYKMLSSNIKIPFFEKGRQNMDEKGKLRLQSLHIREWEEDTKLIT